MHLSKIVSFSVVILLITVLFAGVLTVPAAAQATTANPTTMQFRYNAARTGDYSPVAGTTPPNNHLKWKHSAHGSPLDSSPAVANGMVYIGSENGAVYALNAATGTLKWEYTGGYFGTSSSPAIANGVVYIGNPDRYVYALNAATGALKWKYRTGSSVYSSPAVANGVVYIGSHDGNLYALNAATGALKWKYRTGSSVWSSPAVANGVVYIGSYDGNLYALDAASGKLKWNYTIGGGSSSPAVANGVVYIGSHDGNVYALNAATGTLKWKNLTGDTVESSPAIANGVVYVGSTSNDGNVYALNAATGALKWKQMIDPTSGVLKSSPTYANGVVYIGSDDCNVYALNANTGALKWKYKTADSYMGVQSSPAIANGVVYIGSGDGNVYAIGNQTELKKPTALTLTASDTTPAVNQKVTFTATLKNDTNNLPSKSVTIYHYFNGVRYIDTTKDTNAAGQITLAKSFGSAGQRTYYATFVGDAKYLPSTSSGLNINVGSGAATSTTIFVNDPTPAVNQKVTFTATLKSGTTPLSSKSVTIYHYFNGVRYTDVTATTNAAGQITVVKSFGSAGQYQYYATFAGDAKYLPSTSSVLNINVGTVPVKAQTRIILTASTTTPTIYQDVTFTAKLYWWNSATNQWENLPGKPVLIWHYLNGLRYNDKTINTDSSGKVTFIQTFGLAGKRTYYATFAGDKSYKASASIAVNINIGSTKVTLTASDTSPTVNQQVTFTATLKSGTAPLASQSVTIYHYVNGVRYTDVTKTTNAAGQITFAQTFSSKGVRTYYATYAGVTRYMGSTSSVLTITVH